MRTIQGIVIEDGVKVKRWMVLEDRLCEVCGAKYEPYNQDSACCSKKCYQKRQRGKNPEARAEYRKKYYERNKKKILKHNKKYHAKHREKIKAYHRDLYNANRDERLKLQSEYADTQRHGGMRKVLLEKHGHTCYMCGKENVKNIAAHHKTLDKTDHEYQVLVCLSCHAKIHAFIRWANR